MKREELPQGWGLLVPSGTGLRRVVDGGVLPDPVDPPRSWWTQVFRRLEQGRTLRQRVDAARAEGEREGRNASTWQIENQRDQAVRELQGVRKHLGEFEKASGLNINSWDAGDIGKAVRVVLETRGLVDSAENFLDNVKRAMEDLEKAVAEAKQQASTPEAVEA